MITRDMELVVIIGRLLLMVATLTVISFPILYMFSPWYRRPLGIAIMLQAVTLAVAILLKFTLTFFIQSRFRTALLWANDAVLLMIIVATTALTYLLWSIRRKAEKEARENEQQERSSVE